MHPSSGFLNKTTVLIRSWIGTCRRFGGLISDWEKGKSRLVVFRRWLMDTQNPARDDIVNVQTTEPRPAGRHIASPILLPNRQTPGTIHELRCIAAQP